MALTKFTFHEGTTANPVVLSTKQIKGLVALRQDNNVIKEVSGVVKAKSGQMFKSEYMAIEELGFTIVETTTIPDLFSIYCATSEPVKEGESAQIYVTGMAVEDVVFNIVTHNIVIGNGNITQDTIQDRIHVSSTGLFYVDPAEENASWTDTVSIEAYPRFDPSNKVLINNPISVAAVAMTGIQVTASNSILVGATTNVSASVIPSNCTKSNYRLALSATKGNVTNGVYTAPTSPSTDSIIAECFLFGLSAPSFHVQKNIEVKEPTIVCEIKDKDGEDVEGAYLTITDGVTGVASQLSNGESMVAVLNRTYAIEAFLPEGYDRAIVPSIITPNEVETIVSAVYYPVYVGIVAVFADNTRMEYDEWIANGLPRTWKGSPLYGAGIYSSLGKYMFRLISNNSIGLLVNTAVSGTDATNDASDTGIWRKTSEQAKTATIIRYNYCVANEQSGTAPMLAYESSITLGGQTIKGYLGSFSQLRQLYTYELSKINSIFTSAGNSTIPEGKWLTAFQLINQANVFYFQPSTPTSPQVQAPTAWGVCIAFYDLP